MKKSSSFHIVLLLGLLTILVIPGRALLDGKTLLPLDLLHNALLPWANDVQKPEFADHYSIDAIQEYLPVYQFHADELKNGRFPTWNPYNRGGSAYLDNPVRLPFHPIKWMMLKLPVEQVLDIGAVLHFCLAFSAMAFYLRSFGLMAPAILFGALSWTFCAFFVFGFMHERQIAAISLIPLIMLFFEKLYAKPTGKHVLQTGLVLGLSLLIAGPTAILVFIIILGIRLVSYWMFESIVLDYKRFIALLITAIIAFTLASPTLLSTAHGLFNNVRDFEYSGVYTSGSHIGNVIAGYFGLLISAIHPYALGSRDSIDVLKLAGYTIRLAPFAGSFAIFFALIAVKQFRTQRHTRWLILLFIAGFVLMLPPIVKVLSQRNIIIIVFALVICAALGVDRYLRMSPEQVKRTGKFVFIFTALVWAGFLFRELVLVFVEQQMTQAIIEGIRKNLPGYLFERYPEWKLESGPRFMALQHLSSLPNLLFLGGITVIWFTWRLSAKEERARWRLLVVAVATLAPVLFAAENIFVIDTRLFPVPAKPDYLNLATTDHGPPRVLIPLENPHDRLLMPGNLPQFFGLAQVRGYGSFLSLNTAILTRGLAPEHPLYEVLNVNYLITARDSTVVSTAFSQLVYKGDLNIHTREQPASRFHLTGRLEKTGSREQAASLARADSRPIRQRSFYLVALPDSYKTPFDVIGKLDIKKLETTSAELTVTMETDGLLVVGDSYYPGWQATVNGEPMEIYAVDGALRGIWLTKGSNRVQFEYTHWPSVTGFYLQLALLLIMVGVLGYRHIGKRFLQP